MARRRFDTLGFVLRWGVLAVGLLFLAIGINSWRSGEPPTWTFFKPGTTATVHSAAVRLEPAAKGSTRLIPDVTVVIGAAEPKPLIGTRGPTVYGRPAETAWALADYPLGGRIRVRRVGDIVYADVTDWFLLFHASLTTLLSLFIIGLGLLLNRALK